MKRRRRTRTRTLRRVLLGLAAIPGLYLLAALVGALVPLNRNWVEPARGITIYLADNGVHSDLILPESAAGLDWGPLVPRSDMAAAPPASRWIAFGAGERRVYLDTPTWADLTPRAAWAGIAGGERVMHVEYVADPSYGAREIRLTPEQYRRLWAAIRASFALDAKGRPIHIDHAGYGPGDTFYRGIGRASAIHTCNQWSAERLRLAGVEAPAWSPFPWGLTRRYRPAELPIRQP
jgi:uncharacterized protein (TIGR02117 family)